MKRKTITVTEAARNFGNYVNRAHYQNTTFVLLKNGRPFGCGRERKDREPFQRFWSGPGAWKGGRENR
jgi:hypothetical protein